MKRLSVTDYLLTFLFLFLIVALLGAFFYGVKVGQNKTSEKYEKMLVAKQAESHELTAYHQQYLVSFYHTIYLPYRDFEKKWFAYMETIELGNAASDPGDMFKELSKLADEKFKVIEAMSMPSTSPLLVNAHDSYLKSLRLFADTADNFRAKARSLKGSGLIQAVENDAYFQEGKNFALHAQYSYYSAITEWNKTVNPNLGGVELVDEDNIDFQQWATLNLNLKNNFVAAVLKAQGYFADFYPHDLTARIDELVLSGQAGKMQLDSVAPIVDMLVQTKAVRGGDYLKSMPKLYTGELLPQLPFFLE